MEWTDAAQREMERIQEQIRTSLNPDEVDPAEVADDIQSRIEEELNSLRIHTVTAENDRSAARKIGIQDIIREAPPASSDMHKESFERKLSRPRRIFKRVAWGWFWFAGIILPLIALGTELITHMCLEAGLPDPLSTPFHAVLIALVPLTCILTHRYLLDKKTIRIPGLGLLLGATLSISIFYSLLFAIITPLALIAVATAIVTGVGIIGFLPLSPLLSFITLLRLKFRLKQKSGDKIPRFKTGILLGALAIILASTPMYLTKLGLKMATSEKSATQIKGIKLLRTFGDKILINQACYQGSQMPDPIEWLVTMGNRPSPEDVRSVYYRVTGRAFNTMASPTLGLRTRRNPGDEFDWDPEQGGDVVAGRLKGLSLSESRMDGIVNEDAATAYIEWTMVFKNNWDWEREARAQIALPPGGVVSRLTLWIDGEEREAAFGGRSQVKQAYKQVVQRRRDPVLVTTCGPDRVLMQCFPVPADGEMKIRIGITAPLACLTLEDRRLKLPHLLERNFRIPENVNHAVWIEDHLSADLSDTELNAPGAQIKAQSAVKSCWINNGDATIRQLIQPSNDSKPQQVTIVLDTSLGMKDQFDQIADAVNALPNDINLSIWIVSDGEPYQIERTEIKKLKAGGGKNNAPALRKALMESSKCIVWVHASQEWDLGANEGVRQLLERSPDKQILEIQVNDGPNRLIEKLDTLNGFDSIPRCGSFKEDLERTLKSFSADYTVWETVRSVVQNQDGFHADDHLIRLWANDEINRILSDNNPDNREAIELATEHHLVTPISGAVVLESQEQYEENDLQPVDVANVPSIPEPGTLILLIFALLLLFYGRRMRAHFRTA